MYLIINKCTPFHILYNLARYYLRKRSISVTYVFGYIAGI